MRIKVIVAVVLLFGVVGQLVAANRPELSVRESVTVWWNSGWGDKFYFHTLTLEEALRGGPIDLQKTLRHTTTLNAEFWWTPMNLAGNWPLSFVGKYRHLNYSLGDTIDFSFEHAEKGLEADLNLVSAGIRLGHPVWILNVYCGMDIGYCFGNLVTDQLLESPSDFVYHVQVDGNGGGIFNEFVVGASTGPLFGSFIESDLFFELGFRTTPVWNPFNAEKVLVKEVEGEAGESIQEWLKHEDRQISKLEGFLVSVGLEIRIR